MKLKYMIALVLLLMVGTVILNAQSDSKLDPSFAPLPQTTPDPGVPAPTQSPGNTGSGPTTNTFNFASAPINDGRIGNFGGDGAVYSNTRDGIRVYDIDPNLRGVLVIEMSIADLQDYIDNPRNDLLASSDDDQFKLYSLSSGEFQLNVGPDNKGEIQVVVFVLGGQATDEYTYNICEILRIRNCMR